ncbi:polysaccharide deacetylase family protein [bacterium]|nr:polysaccharide deacetylase family protein [bacterium]
MSDSGRPLGAALDPRGVFAIKVDVDTEIGLRDGAPRLLELFERLGVRASWYVSMGPDRTGLSALRVFRQRGFLGKMVRSRATRIYPWQTMLRGTLLPPVQIAAGHPGRLHEIAAAGHELGVHGWDHVRWHDGLARMTEDEVAAEVGQAKELFEALVGRAPEGFAAPGWQCTGRSLWAVDAAGFRHRSDSRGWFPYRPQADGYVSSVPEIPTTLPTLDEVLGAGHGRGSVVEVSAAYLREIRDGALNVHTIHTEIEGGDYLGHLEDLLRRLRDRLLFATLGEVAASLPPVAELPLCSVVPGRLPGRGGTVATQVRP